MDAEYDIHDDDCYYSDDETMIASGDDDDGDGHDEYLADASDKDESDDDDDSKSNRQHKQNYRILNEEDISERMEEDITRISTVLTVSRESATILLRHYDWDVSKVHDAWFEDEEKVRNEVGLLVFDQIPANDVKNKQKLLLGCGICFDSYPVDVMNAAACGHYFCRECWMGYVGTSVSDGPGCLMLRCPEPSCGAAVGQDMINLFASDEDKQKYSRYLFRSYIEANKKTKWCPAPGCDYAVDFVVGSGGYDVSCKCTNRFCWNCTEEAHSPIDCTTVAKWISKNSSESENTNWILVNSKPCPQCKRPIEKNQGCMHMVCTPPCEFHFCWLCLGAWSDHGANTGGFYACNSYLKAKEEGTFNEAENRREMAKRSIERYTHYYERWATNQKSMQKAVADFKQMQSVDTKGLREKKCLQLESEFMFITEAWLQIIECRRVLKWTYAYGYYLPEEEHAKRGFFEYIQGEAESGLERLHQFAEKELQGYLNSDGPSKDFPGFREKLAGLTSVNRNYFETLVRALENDLSDVDSQAVACSQSGILENNSAPMPIDKRPSRVVEDFFWSCEQCTYTNFDMTIMDCQMCQLPSFY